LDGVKRIHKEWAVVAKPLKRQMTTSFSGIVRLNTQQNDQQRISGLNQSTKGKSSLSSQTGILTPQMKVVGLGLQFWILLSYKPKLSA
jgi:hypothetical protein